MSLNWQVIKTHKLALLGAPILCGLALLLLVVLFRLENLSRGAVAQETLIIIEAEHERSEDHDLETEHDGAEYGQALPEKLQQRLAALTVSKKTALSHAPDYLQGIEPTEYSKNDRQYFYEQLGSFWVKKKEYAAAVDVFSKISDDNYLQKRTGFYSALAHSKAGDTQAAIQMYERQLNTDPYHQASAINYGMLLIKTEQYEKSIPALEHAIEITSGKRKAKALRLIGGVYESLAQAEHAIEAYRRSIIFEPDNSKVWLLLGNALASEHKNVEGTILETLQKAIALAPNNYKARLSLANFYFSRLDFENARKEFTEAARRASRRSELRLMQALNLFSSGRPHSAKKVLKAMKDTNAEDEQVAEFITFLVDSDYVNAKPILNNLKNSQSFDKNTMVYLQLLYFVENTADEPIANGRVETDVDSVFYWPSQLLLARYLNKRQRYKDALEIEAEILAKIPHNAEVLLIHGRSLSKSGQTQLALKALAEAYALQKTSRRISVEYINELEKTEDYESALKVVNAVLVQHPNYKRALRLKVDLLTKTQRIKQAISLLTNIFNSDGDNTDEGYMLAELYYQGGKIESSLQTLTELLDMDSANINARLLRAKILHAESRFSESSTEVTRILRLAPGNENALALKDLMTQVITPDGTTEETKNDTNNTP